MSWAAKPGWVPGFPGTLKKLPRAGQTSSPASGCPSSWVKASRRSERMLNDERDDDDEGEETVNGCRREKAW